MEWSLAIVALALLGVAAVSRRLSGTPITPAMVFVAVGLLVGPEVLDGIDLESSSATVRTLAEATLALVLFCDASRHRSRAAAPRGRACRCVCSAIGLPLTIALGARRGGRDLRSADHRGGRHPGRGPGADRRRAGAGGRHRAAHPREDPPGTQRRERAQRRHLRPAAVRGRRGRRRGIGDLRGPQRRHAPARGDRLRGRRRCRRRARRRGDHHLRRPPRADRRCVAAGDPGRRRGAGLRDGRRARRIGLHRGVRRGHDLPAGARARPRARSTSSASRSGACSTASPSCSSGPSCSDPRSAN